MRERGRERQRETERDRERQRETERQRDTGRWSTMAHTEGLNSSRPLGSTLWSTRTSCSLPVSVGKQGHVSMGMCWWPRRPLENSEGTVPKAPPRNGQERNMIAYRCWACASAIAAMDSGTYASCCHATPHLLHACSTCRVNMERCRLHSNVRSLMVMIATTSHNDYRLRLIFIHIYEMWQVDCCSMPYLAAKLHVLLLQVDHGLHWLLGALVWSVQRCRDKCL